MKRITANQLKTGTLYAIRQFEEPTLEFIELKTFVCVLKPIRNHLLRASTDGFIYISMRNVNPDKDYYYTH